jgi:two-component system, cell cycle response regulator
MTSKHSARHAVHVAGFPAQEKSVFEQFFHIAGQRPPGWWLTNKIEEAAVVLLRASYSEDIDAFYGQISPWQKVIVIGLSDFGTGWPFMPRPIKLMAILNKINELVRQGELGRVADTVPASLDQLAQATQPMPLRAVVPERTSAPAPLMPAFVEHLQTMTPVAVPLAVPVPLPPGTVSIDNARSFVAPTARVAAPVPRQVVQVPVDKPQASLQKPAAVAPVAKQALGKVLVVDDSDVALKFMQNRLRQFGYEGQLARSGEEALALVAEADFKFVFMDVMMTGLDGYQTCKAIKQNKARTGTAPVVVMLTSRGGTIDKIRGTMAGCDAYLTKPLNEKHLVTILVKHDPAMAAELQNTDGASRFLASDRPASRFN